MEGCLGRFVFKCNVIAFLSFSNYGRDVGCVKGLDDFIFASKNGVNRIKDFNASDGREDINLAAVKAIKSMTDLKNNHMTQLGDNVVIDDGAATKIIILDTLLSELDRSDFIF